MFGEVSLFCVIQQNIGQYTTTQQKGKTFQFQGNPGKSHRNLSAIIKDHKKYEHMQIISFELCDLKSIRGISNECATPLNIYV